MKRTPDNNTYWITLTRLSTNVEYGFQYLVNGTLTLANPYAEKILEKEDGEIDNDTYPNLKDYYDYTKSIDPNLYFMHILMFL